MTEAFVTQLICETLHIHPSELSYVYHERTEGRKCGWCFMLEKGSKEIPIQFKDCPGNGVLYQFQIGTRVYMSAAIKPIKEKRTLVNQ